MKKFIKARIVLTNSDETVSNSVSWVNISKAENIFLDKVTATVDGQEKTGEVVYVRFSNNSLLLDMKHDKFTAFMDDYLEDLEIEKNLKLQRLFDRVEAYKKSKKNKTKKRGAK